MNDKPVALSYTFTHALAEPVSGPDAVPDPDTKPDSHPGANADTHT